MVKYTYVALCYDSGESNPYISDDTLQVFDSKEEAFKAAETAATDECESLIDGCSKGVSFGIPEDDAYQNMDRVVVNYYYEDNTETVTVREIRSIRVY